jgi:hypothetical protein
MNNLPSALSLLLSCVSVKVVGRVNGQLRREYVRNDANWSDVFLVAMLRALLEDAIAVDDVIYCTGRRANTGNKMRMRHVKTYTLPSFRLFCRLSGVCLTFRRMCETFFLTRFRMMFIGVSRGMQHHSSVTGSVFPILLWYAFSTQFVQLLREYSPRATRIFQRHISARVHLSLETLLKSSDDELIRHGHMNTAAPYCFHMVSPEVYRQGWRATVGIACGVNQCYYNRQTLVKPVDVKIILRLCSNVHLTDELRLLWRHLEHIQRRPVVDMIVHNVTTNNNNNNNNKIVE